MANYSKMKVAELKQELEIRGLDATGKKADLVSRLEDDDKGATSTSKNMMKFVWVVVTHFASIHVISDYNWV